MLSWGGGFVHNWQKGNGKSLGLKYLTAEGGSEEDKTTLMQRVREQQGFIQPGKECGSACSTTKVTLHPSAKDQLFSLPYLSVLNSPRHSLGGSKQFPACSFCSMNRETQRVLPDTADVGDKPPQRARCLVDSSGQVSSESRSLWWDEHPLLCRCAPSRSHSGCTAVTHFPAGSGQTMQNVKPGLWVAGCYSRLAAQKVSYHSCG